MAVTETIKVGESLFTDEMYDHPIWDAVDNFVTTYGELSTLKALGMCCLAVCDRNNLADFDLIGPDGNPAVSVRAFTIDGSNDGSL